MPLNGSFDEEYKTSKSYWGDAPSSAIKKYSHFLQSGTVLDIGAGDGRNTLYLAKRNHSVVALDLSETGLLNLKDKADSQGIAANIRTIAADFIDTPVDEASFANIITHFTIHFVGGENIIPFVSKMMLATKPGGINVIDDFTQNGPLAIEPEKYITQTMIDAIYQNEGWEVLINETREVETKAFESPGKHYKHEALIFIARKPLL